MPRFGLFDKLARNYFSSSFISSPYQRRMLTPMIIETMVGVFSWQVPRASKISPQAQTRKFFNASHGFPSLSKGGGALLPIELKNRLK